MEAPLINLTDADHAMMAEAGRAFRTDFRYAEAIFWAARERRHLFESAPEPEPPAPDPYAVMTATLEALEPRLLKHVTPDPSGCWSWVGGCTGNTQPTLLLGGKYRPVKRWLYEQEHGPQPRGVHVRSKRSCRPRCVRPDHLRVTSGSQSRTRA